MKKECKHWHTKDWQHALYGEDDYYLDSYCCFCNKNKCEDIINLLRGKHGEFLK